MNGNKAGELHVHLRLSGSRGAKTAVDGATYPLRMEYDIQGRRTALKTTRDGESWDETRWTHDPATGLCLSKTYADNSTISYTYTPDGLPARTTWPDGRWQENAYDAARNVAGIAYSDGTPGLAFACDAYGETTNAVDDAGNAWWYVYGGNSALLCETNVLAGGRLSPAAGQGGVFVPSTGVMSRALDAQGRPAGYSLSVDGTAKGGIGYAYGDEGRVVSISATNSAGHTFSVSYLHGNGHVNGYEIELSGGVFRRNVTRDPYRRELVEFCSSSLGVRTLDSYVYGYNPCGWPLSRNGDSFAYNARGEVTRAEIGSHVFMHEYDGIGNHTLWGDNAVTNEYAHNSLNQLTSSQRISVPSVAPCEMTYSSNGGLASDGTWLYAYDAEDRLVSVTSASLTNGALCVENAYDWRDRRISKTVSRYDSTDETWNVVERRAFTYDDWNLVHETIMQIGGAVPTATEVQYFWGLDLSETLQGAGGVGGLLAVSINGAFYIPCYDNNGNVTKYVGETGAVVASYAYDDFGRIISQSGPLADAFPHRFSTKHFDAETGLCYYGRRFYSPLLKRWLNRDPMGEDGGENVFEFCEGNPVSIIDVQGLFTWEIWKKVVVYDLGYWGEYSPPHEFISGRGQDKAGRDVFARTGLFWDVDVVCRCVSNKWMAVDAKGFVLPEVHMRRDKFTKRAKTLILAKEDDHVWDITIWFRSTGRKVVEDYFREVNRNRFKRYSKHGVCKRTSNEELFHEVSIALSDAINETRKRWDVWPKGLKAPHDLNIKKNKEGVYDIVD